MPVRMASTTRTVDLDREFDLAAVRDAAATVLTFARRVERAIAYLPDDKLAQLQTESPTLKLLAALRRALGV